MSIHGHFEKWHRERYYMIWIFGSFLVTRCALISCHVVISKQQPDQDTWVQQVCNWIGDTDEWLRAEKPVVEEEEKQLSERRDTSCKGAEWSVSEELEAERDLAPGRSIGKKKSSPWVCLSTHLSHTTETSTLSRIKCGRYIFIKKCDRSFIEVRKLCLIIFPLVFVLQLYNTNSYKKKKKKKIHLGPDP